MKDYKMKWYRWSERLPPFKRKVAFYSEKTGKSCIGHWSHPICSNKEQVIENLKTGVWKSVGVNDLSSASHWCLIPDFPPLKKSEEEALCPVYEKCHLR
jgi:hypothetical protein